MSVTRWYLRCKQKLFVEVIKSRKSLKSFLKFFGLVFSIAIIVLVSLLKFVEYNNDPLSITRHYIYVEPASSFFRFSHNTLQEEKDWHDYKLIEEESKRIGPGEQGKPHNADPSEEALRKKIFDENGYNGLVSDKISLNRSVPDIRHKDCKKKTYLKELPSVSVVIPFFNDHLSTLLRTVYSVINRSPPELLKEVILVNDHSTKDFLYKELEDYIALHLKHMVRLFVLPVRSGLIWARLAGARAATGDILVFLDSHTEANVNWLPPLIDPIARNHKVCTCPYIDVIDFNNYEYRGSLDGARGIFDWNFEFQRIPVKKEHQKSLADPFPNPVMVGGLFAISAKFFWELGGYDTGLDIWGGEQYELSFKVWLCGGELYDVPCSRVAHVYRGGMPFPNDRKGIDFITINYKRVAEVWMDEYKEFIYKRAPERYSKVSAGDLSYQFQIKKKNNCKPFKYFIDHVAPDMLDRYPMIEKPAFASGALESMALPELCLDTMGRDKEQPLGLYPCAENKTHPQDTQFYILRHSRDIHINRHSRCLDAPGGGDKVKVITYPCHHGQGNQYFRYDIDTNQIYHGPWRNHKCMDLDPKDRSIFLSTCDTGSKTQKWRWGFVNETNIRNWLTYGASIEDKQEILDLTRLQKKV